MKIMLFRKLLPLFALFAVFGFFGSKAAHAQFGVYGTVTGEQVHNLTCTDLGSNAVGACATPTTTEKPYGANFGAYYDFRNLGPARLGFDLRGGVLNTNKNTADNTSSRDFIRQYTVLGGVRASFNTPFHLIRPYGEVAVGYAKFGPVYAYNTYTEAEGLVGIDVPVLPIMDIRAIEFGAGGLFGSGTHSLQSIGVGLVFHTTR